METLWLQVEGLPGGAHVSRVGIAFIGVHSGVRTKPCRRNVRTPTNMFPNVCVDRAGTACVFAKNPAVTHW